MSPADDAGASVSDSSDEIAMPLVERLLDEAAARSGPLFVGLDGRSGAGKSSVAAAVAGRLAGGEHVRPTVTVIEGDQFYAGGSGASWDERTPAQKAAWVIDWRRQRSVLRQLRDEGAAEWHPFDWEAEDWDTENVPLSTQSVRSVVAPVVMLEGAYSCRPELHDLLDLLVLLEIPRDVRRRQLLGRQGDEYRADWEARWSAAEDYYFGSVMPAKRFDLVLGSP
jgi:uridine kinase